MFVYIVSINNYKKNQYYLGFFKKKKLSIASAALGYPPSEGPELISNMYAQHYKNSTLLVFYVSYTFIVIMHVGLSIYIEHLIFPGKL